MCSEEIAGQKIPEGELDQFQTLTAIVERLRAPGGCPWDREQTHETLKKHLIEEAYELIQAIDERSDEKMKEELGDVLLQPVMHAQMRKLEGGWDIDDVARGIIDKLVRRHPHVFGDADAKDAEEVLKNWDRIKQNEKGDRPQSVLAGVPQAMPALLRAHEISKRAARCGFEWPDIDSVWRKMKEEEHELREAVKGGDPAAVAQEVGDLLFTAVNIARWAGVEPEDALRTMLDRFVRRFQAMERMAEGPLADLGPAAWDNLWERAKAEQAVGES
ncbi:MAG: nucleoside triphosphate pyrophosphohydrolase [Armatimonadetes bacterium]|nr:nucleoside triphosphate pyrophosphohydrolase [Armatimonadota bacterium]